MKAILLLVAVVAVLTNMAQAKANRNLLLERLIYGEESLADDLETTEKVEKEMESASQTCCYPKSFQSTIHVYQPGMSAPLQKKLFVDAGNGRLAITNGANRVVITCSCCSCRVTMIDDAQRRCRQVDQPGLTFDNEFDLCVPPQATSLGPVRMGTDGLQQSSMLVQQWAYPSAGNANVRRLATANGCFPVAEVMTHTSGACQSELVDIHYFDVTSPVRDTRVFAIPPYCGRDDTEVEAVGDEKSEWKPFYLRFM